MADLTNSSWSEADSSNTQPSPAGFPSGILPSQVGGVVRALMGAVKRSFDRSNVMTTSTGSANAYVLTYAQPPEGYVTGEIYRFFANFTNTAAPTLNINGLGTRAILRADGTAMAANEIVSGQVVSVVVSGNNFLHQPVGTRFFTDDVSIQKASDSVMALEDTSAPATTFRQKKIYSSKNVGGGDDWLFRMVRPSDGATRDFILDDAAPGTVWTTGNFNPALKADLAGAVFSGDITTYRAAANTTGVIYLGQNGGGRYLYYDGATYNLPGAQTNLAALNVSGSATVSGNTTLGGQLFVRSGRLHVADNNAAGYVSFGNNDQATFGHDSANFVANGPGTLYVNNIEVTRQNQYHTASGYGFAAHNTYLYADAGVENLVARTGPPNAYRYTTIDPNGFLTAAGGIRANGDLFSTGRVVVGEGQAASYIEMRDADEGTRYVHNNGGNIGFLGADANWKMRVNDGGQVWTAQFGDLATYIQTYANNAAGARVAKTGDIMSGNLSIQPPSYPSINFLYPNVKWWGWQVRENGWFYAGEDNLANFNFALVPGGNIWSNAFGGYLTDYVTNKANAAANARGDRVYKGGDTMSGDLTISKAYPTVTLLWGNVYRLGLQLREDARFYLMELDTGAAIMSVGPGGDIWTRQIGDLNSRIENRASDFANDRLNTATARINNKSARLAMLADIQVGSYQSGGPQEPYGGGVLTGVNQMDGRGYASAFRFRQLQMSDSNGNWYACGYV